MADTRAVSPREESAIRAALNEYVSAALRQDWDSFVRVFDPEPLCMPAGVPAMMSHDAIRSFYAGFPRLDSLSLTPESFEATGELIVEVGYYDFSSGSIRERGKYLHLWRRQSDGAWKLYRNIANSDGNPGQVGSVESPSR